MKLKRKAAGVYHAGPVEVHKMYGQWALIGHGCKMLSVPTLRDARQLLPHIRPYLHAAQERQRDAQLKERRQRATGIIRQCRLIDSATPPRGIAWAEWAESRMGTTAAEIRAACELGTVDDAMGELETRFTSKQMERIGEWLRDNGYAA